MEYVEYDVCEGFFLEEFKAEVLSALNDGWELQGGISVTPYSGKENEEEKSQKFIFHQAIARKVKIGE